MPSGRPIIPGERRSPPGLGPPAGGIIPGSPIGGRCPSKLPDGGGGIEPPCISPGGGIMPPSTGGGGIVPSCAYTKPAAHPETATVEKMAAATDIYFLPIGIETLVKVVTV